MRNRESEGNSGNRGLGLGITSLILGLISMVPTIYSILMLVQSITLANTDGASMEEALGNAFAVLFITMLLIPALIVIAILSTIGLGFGIGSLTKSKTTAPRVVGIIGTTISALSLLGAIASFLTRVLIK